MRLPLSLLLSVKKLIKILFYIISALYPLLIFTSLVIFKLPVRILSLCMIALALGYFLTFTGSPAAAAAPSVSGTGASASAGPLRLFIPCRRTRLLSYKSDSLSPSLCSCNQHNDAPGLRINAYFSAQHHLPLCLPDRPHNSGLTYPAPGRSLLPQGLPCLVRLFYY